MKTERKIFFAFILNLFFSLFELIGGIYTGSVAILSDSLHDLCDALSIGISYFLEKKSRKGADERYTYGYGRYSILGGLITTMILIFGSAFMIYNAVKKIIDPVDIKYDGMIIIAVVGLIINIGAAYLTRGGKSLNQRAVYLHMLEDVSGWTAVLLGAVIMKFTDFAIIDPILSILISVFILIAAVRNLKKVIDLFLEKTPDSVTPGQVKEKLEKIEGVKEIHHIHLRSSDGNALLATMHVVTDSDVLPIKLKIRDELYKMGICHVTLETEKSGEQCNEKCCNTRDLLKEDIGHCHNHGHRH